MRLAYSTDFRNDLSRSVLAAIASAGIVNVPLVAEAIRKRHEIENIALEDVELLVIETAQLFSAIVEFDSAAIDTSPGADLDDCNSFGVAAQEL